VKDSQKLKKIRDKAIGELEHAFEQGVIEDKKYTNLAVQALQAYQKARNYEIKEDALTFVVNKSLTENLEELKKILPRTLPKYCKVL